MLSVQEMQTLCLPIARATSVPVVLRWSKKALAYAAIVYAPLTKHSAKIVGTAMSAGMIDLATPVITCQTCCSGASQSLQHPQRTSSTTESSFVIAIEKGQQCAAVG